MPQSDSGESASMLGRPAKLRPEHVCVIRALVNEHPLCTMAELAVMLQQRCGVQVSVVTLAKALRSAGIVRVKPERSSSYVPRASDKAPRYGYSALHRGDDARRYASDLSNAEWDLVKDLFEPDMAVGKPPSYSRRSMVDACCYVVRTGCAWRLLPKSFPHWDSVYKTFRRWSEQGKFELMHDMLRQQWRECAGRNEVSGH